MIGPGSLFTSVLAAVAVPGIARGHPRSSARSVYVANLRPQEPETEGYDVAAPRGRAGRPRGQRRRGGRRPAAISLGDLHPDRSSAAQLAKPNGLAHDPARLAAALSGLVG